MIGNNKNNIEIQKEGWSTVNPSQQNKGNIITKISIFILVFIISVTIIGLGVLMGIKNGNNKNVAVGGKDSNGNTVTNLELEASKGDGLDKDNINNFTYEFSLEELYKYVHKMTNTIIIPEDGEKIGAVIITKESIEKALAESKNREPELYEEISTWLNLDFSNAVEVHNTVWSRLDGNIGRATTVDDEAVEIVKNRIRN